MESYLLIVKTLWAAIAHGTWSQVGNVILLAFALVGVDKICTGLRYAIYLLIVFDLAIAIVYLCQRKKRQRAIICMIVLLFIIALYRYLVSKG